MLGSGIEMCVGIRSVIVRVMFGTGACYPSLRAIGVPPADVLPARTMTSLTIVAVRKGLLLG